MQFHINNATKGVDLKKFKYSKYSTILEAFMIQTQRHKASAYNKDQFTHCIFPLPIFHHSDSIFVRQTFQGT